MDLSRERVLVHLKCTNGITRVIDCRCIKEIKPKDDYILVLCEGGEYKVRSEEREKLIDAAKRTGGLDYEI